MGHEIGEFLRTRRARIQPTDAGLPDTGRRRVPGLRREELAQLAGVSVDYYVRLEQGRTPSVSDAVLDAIARVLQLDATEREHLRRLARARVSRPAIPGRRQRVRPGPQRLLDLMVDVPAFVLGRRMDILAWNRLADVLHGFADRPAEQLNVARLTFLEPAAVDFYPEWDAVARETVAYLRLDAGRHPDDPRLAALIDELSLGNETFRRLWSQHPVSEKTHGDKRINHPLVGALEFRYETLALPGDPDQMIVAYTVEPASPTADRLRQLLFEPVVGIPLVVERRDLSVAGRAIHGNRLGE
jgi:transcriptional regulator with XRE-family HTH domain